MRTIYLAFLLLPQLCPAQKITKEIEPDNHAVWLSTDQFLLWGIHLSFRTIDQAVFLDVVADGDAIGPRDYVAFITQQDTVVAHSIGLQPGLATTGTYSAPQVHEYALSVDDLRKLAASPTYLVTISHFAGFQYVKVSDKWPSRLIAWSKALLTAMGD